MSHAIHAHELMQLIAGNIQRGETLDGDEMASIRIIGAYCEAIREGGSLEPADIHERAFGKKEA